MSDNKKEKVGEKEKKEKNAKLKEFYEKTLTNYESDTVRSYANNVIGKIKKIVELKKENSDDYDEIKKYNKIIDDKENWDIVKNDNLPMVYNTYDVRMENRYKRQKLESKLSTVNRRIGDLERGVDHFKKNPTWSHYYVSKFTNKPIKTAFGNVAHPWYAKNYKSKVKDWKKELGSRYSQQSDIEKEIREIQNSTGYEQVWEPQKYDKDVQLESLTFLWVGLLKIKLKKEEEINELKNSGKNENIEKLNNECAMLNDIQYWVEKIYDVFKITRRLREEIIDDELKNNKNGDGIDYEKANSDFLKEMEKYK